ncbi:MAG TPA: hypothetical protein VNK91_02130 [Burkholderiaceae bacterium]|nr:hypothetical protein [Burkholderiaceae bacterium]
MRNKMQDLRDHLFATLEALRDGDKSMSIDRAKAIADVAQTIINSATVEVKFLQVTGAKKGTGFIPEDDGALAIERTYAERRGKVTYVPSSK